MISYVAVCVCVSGWPGVGGNPYTGHTGMCGLYHIGGFIPGIYSPILYFRILIYEFNRIHQKSFQNHHRESHNLNKISLRETAKKP